MLGARTTNMRSMSGQRRPTSRAVSISVDLRADQLVTALDLMADGLTVVNRDGKMVYVNRPLCEMFGYDAATLVGQSVEMLVPDDLRRAHRRDRVRFVGAGRSRLMGRADLDIEGRHADGHHFAIDVQLAPLAETGMVAATVRDVTEVRRHAVDRALGRLDLQSARVRIASLIAAHDDALQRLFALGAHFEAQASRSSPGTGDRFSAAANTIDEVIVSIRDAALGPQVDMS